MQIFVSFSIVRTINKQATFKEIGQILLFKSNQSNIHGYFLCSWWSGKIEKNKGELKLALFSAPLFSAIPHLCVSGCLTIHF